jgi:hypothetical protein
MRLRGARLAASGHLWVDRIAPTSVLGKQRTSVHRRPVPAFDPEEASFASCREDKRPGDYSPRIAERLHNARRVVRADDVGIVSHI